MKQIMAAMALKGLEATIDVSETVLGQEKTAEMFEGAINFAGKVSDIGMLNAKNVRKFFSGRNIAGSIVGKENFDKGLIEDMILKEHISTFDLSRLLDLIERGIDPNKGRDDYNR